MTPEFHILWIGADTSYFQMALKAFSRHGIGLTRVEASEASQALRTAKPDCVIAETDGAEIIPGGFPILWLIDNPNEPTTQSDTWGLIPGGTPAELLPRLAFWAAESFRRSSLLAKCQRELDSTQKRASGLGEENKNLKHELARRGIVEEALRESEIMYRALFENAPVGIGLATIDGRLFGSNDSLFRLIGSPSEKTEEPNLIDLFADRESFRALLDRLKKESFIRDLEIELVRGNGKPFHAILCITLLSHDGTDFLLAVIEDISELKRVEKKLKSYAERLKLANDELSQYDYAVAHDIRAPLRAIKNYKQFLVEDLRGSLSGEHLEYLEGMDKAVTQAENLVADLLRLTRIGKEELQTERIDLEPFFAELVPSLNLPADVVVETAERAPSVLAEPALLRQVFTNLIDNAVKFNESPVKRVRIGFGDDRSGAVEIVVSDNGIGIDPKYHDKIFRIFERLHTASEYDGTGLGLAIVKKSIIRMNGSVRLQSEPGKGSVFTILLPRAVE